MASYLTDNDLAVLYHSLGADQAAYLELFEDAFSAAEIDYRLADIDALLKLLADPTLPDPRLRAWRNYYAARSALLRWDLAEVKRLLNAQVEVSDQQMPRLASRHALLRAQVSIMEGDWLSGLNELRDLRQRYRRNYNRDLAAEEPNLAAAVEEWTARAFIGRAQSAGDWEESGDGARLLAWRYFQVVALFPLYLLLLAALNQLGAASLRTAAIRYGRNVSNWPIFAYYLSAHRALSRALSMPAQADPHRIIRLKLMQADLLRRVGATSQAVSAYKTLQDEYVERDADYRAALIAHGLGQSYIGMEMRKDARENLERALVLYEGLDDRRSLAYVRMLSGDVAALEHKYETAVDLWRHALHAFHNLDDALGIAETLNRCYALLRSTSNQARDIPRAVQQDASAVLRQPEYQVYTVRIPSRLFAAIRLAGWVVPLVVLLIIAILTTSFIENSSREQMVARAMDILSVKGLLTLIGAFVIFFLFNAALGVVGLIATFWTDSARLDIITLRADGLSWRGFSDESDSRMSWDTIATFYRVERGFGLKPSRTLSFDLLRASDGEARHLPAATSRFEVLQEAIPQYLGRQPRIIRLYWYGGAALVSIPLALAIAGYFSEARIPGGSPQLHAWLASGTMAVEYLGLAVVTVALIVHYLRVVSQTTARGRYRMTTGVLAALMLGVGTAGVNLVFIFAPLFVVGGTVLIVGFLRTWSGGASASWQRLRAGAWRLAALGGVLITLWLTVPVLLNYQAFTYSGAASVGHPGCSATGAAGDRSVCFAAMRRLGHSMVSIDPTYTAGYAYIGYGEYYLGGYEARIGNSKASSDAYVRSVWAYTEAIARGNQEEQADFSFCRAQAFEKQGDEAAARANCAMFRRRWPLGNELPVCQRLFTEDAGICDELQ